MRENKKFIFQKNYDSSVSQNSQKKNFVITKKVAKHGSQAIIVIPRILEEHLKPGTLAQISIEVLENVNSDNNLLEEGK